MKVAMVAACPFPSPQGSQVFIGQMCARLAARGHEVHLLTYGHGRSQADRGFYHHRIKRLPGDGSMRSGPSLLKPALDILMLGELKRMLAERPVDIVHAHNYEAAMVALAVRGRARVPVVYHSHNLMGDELPTYFRGPLLKRAAAVAGRILDGNVPRRADQSIALCDLSAGLMRNLGVEEGRVNVIPVAVEDEGPRRSPQAARLRLGIPSAAWVLGYAGNLDRYQNLELMLETARLAAAAGDHGFLLLVATHQDGDRRFAQLINRREYRGFVRVEVVRGYEGARLAMEACDVLCLPRRRGSGCPVKLANYMSLGVPVLSAGCGGKLLRDGVDAVVVADDDPVSMSQAALGLLKDPALRLRLGREARNRFLSSMSWEVVAPAIEAVYEKTLAAGPVSVGAEAVNM